MKRKILNLRRVKTMDEEIRIMCYCTECGSPITDDIEEYYCDEDGNYFDSAECAMVHHGIHLLEE